MGFQESGLRLVLDELITLQVAAVKRKEAWRRNHLKGYVVTCPQLDYRQFWFTHDREWQHVEHPIHPENDTLWMTPSGLDHGSVVYSVGVAIVGDLLSVAVQRMRDDPRNAAEFGVYVRECEIFLQSSIRTMVVGGYAHEAHRQADIELRRHLKAITGLAGYDGIFGVAETEQREPQQLGSLPSQPRTARSGAVSEETTPLEFRENSRYSRGDRTSLVQFTAALANPIARRGLGIEISDAEGRRIANDPILARAYYNNWTSEDAEPAPIMTGSYNTAAARPESGAAGHRITPLPNSGAGHRAEATRPLPHLRTQAIVGLALGVLAYLFSGGWLSPVLAIPGLAVSIRAIVKARAARGRPHAAAALTMAIIGTGAAGTALLLAILYLAR